MHTFVFVLSCSHTYGLRDLTSSLLVSDIPHDPLCSLSWFRHEEFNSTRRRADHPACLAYREAAE